ncbi:hypothetical protein [Flavobacterium sp.]|uniref:hypothetical protein n=1 Tax=Flavobacterium sp. TaxID=239 RepID=UPI0035294223
MKTKIIILMLGLLVSLPALAQDKTTVRANSTDISDNLDLRAVATIFGDSKDLEDFEQRLNDPKAQISNLDLNGDNYVDYLRVIESIEGNAHIIVIQAVLDKDLYQDIATVEVEKDRNNNVAVQVVGDVYMYGTNYIYEPVYVTRPIIYTTFWTPYYRPYCSAWYWGYYPSYYTYWAPYPVFRYRNNIALYINYGITYNYVNYRRCSTAYNAYYGRRANGYETRYPNRSFTHRNNGYANRYEMDQNRTIRTRVAGTRELASNTTRNSTNNSVRTTRNSESTRNNNATSIRNISETRNESTTRNEGTNVPIRSTTQSVRNNKNVSSTRNTTTTRTPRVSSTPNRSSSNSVSTRSSSTRSNSSMSTRNSTSSRSSSNATRSSSNTSRGQSSNRGGRS